MKIYEKNELNNCDYIKAILMFAVVIGHCSATWSKDGWFIYEATVNPIMNILDEYVSSFHIYCFVLISGYLYQYLRFEKKKYFDIKSFILGKARRLLLPYITVSMIWAIPFWAYFYSPNIKEVIRNYILAVSPSQLWFLWMLFWVFIIERILIEKINTSFGKGFVCLLLWGCGLIGKIYFENYFQIFNGFQYCIFFFLGMKIREGSIDWIRKVPLTVYVGGHIFLLLIKLNFVCGNSKFEKLGFELYLLVLHIVSALAVFFVLNSLLSKEKLRNNRVLKIMGKYNFIIYLFHQQIIWMV